MLAETPTQVVLKLVLTPLLAQFAGRPGNATCACVQKCASQHFSRNSQKRTRSCSFCAMACSSWKKVQGGMKSTEFSWLICSWKNYKSLCFKIICGLIGLCQLFLQSHYPALQAFDDLRNLKNNATCPNLKLWTPTPESIFGSGIFVPSCHKPTNEPRLARQSWPVWSLVRLSRSFSRIRHVESSMTHLRKIYFFH